MAHSGRNIHHLLVPPPGQEYPSKVSSIIKVDYYSLGKAIPPAKPPATKRVVNRRPCLWMRKAFPVHSDGTTSIRRATYAPHLLFVLTGHFMSYRISHRVSIRTCTECFGSILTPITPTCLPCKVHSSMCGYIQVPANCCFLAGLFRVWPIERIRSCRIHTGTRIPPWTP